MNSIKYYDLRICSRRGQIQDEFEEIDVDLFEEYEGVLKYFLSVRDESESSILNVVISLPYEDEENLKWKGIWEKAAKFDYVRIWPPSRPIPGGYRFFQPLFDACHQTKTKVILLDWPPLERVILPCRVGFQTDYVSHSLANNLTYSRDTFRRVKSVSFVLKEGVNADRLPISRLSLFSDRTMFPLLRTMRIHGINWSYCDSLIPFIPQIRSCTFDHTCINPLVSMLPFLLGMERAGKDVAWPDGTEEYKRCIRIMLVMSIPFTLKHRCLKTSMRWISRDILYKVYPMLL